MRKLPLLRGVVLLAETLFLAVSILLYSANASLDEEEKISTPLIWILISLSLAFTLGLFFVAPLLLSHLPFLSFSSSLANNLVEGIIRIGIFLLYLWGLSFLPEAKRVFAYHGAEHKVINAHERGAPLEVEEVKKFSTSHIRCGTSFLLTIFVLAVVIFAIVGRPGGMWGSIFSRILLIPVLAALSYEVTRWSILKRRNPVMRLLLVPGMALQAMTTREPDDSQIEVAISALKGAIRADSQEGQQESGEESNEASEESG
jgi:hypothetical protein